MAPLAIKVPDPCAKASTNIAFSGWHVSGWDGAGLE